MGAIGIEFKNDRTRAKEELEGSDGRANVSSRQDSRAYYNSRDEGQTYSFPFEFSAAESGEFAAYFKNTNSAGLQFVPTSIICSAGANVKLKLWFVTGTAAGGDLVTPTNDNKTSPNAATAVAMEGGSAGTGITGLTADSLIETTRCAANHDVELSIADSVRIGQNDAIAIEVDEGTAADVEGTILGFYEAV